MSDYLDLLPEVRDAVRTGRPVVALESTIISHGMPYPQNVETAREVEAIIRDAGAVPATIAIVSGRIKVGLSEELLTVIGSEPGVVKVSVREIPVVVAKKLHGATTVSATMFIARLAGIRIFVTGGIGGVHRNFAQNFDISADLTELGRTEVAVVCAGAKAILDLGLTLEYLETLGVPVLGYGTDYFPAFYTRSSGFRVQHRVDTPEEVADIMRAQWSMGLGGGLVVANPIPSQYELGGEEVEATIRVALAEAEEKGITGRDVTPFLLARLHELSGGESLRANIELVKNNARLGAQIARAYWTEAPYRA